jgi:hypothetical protein
MLGHNGEATALSNVTGQGASVFRSAQPFPVEITCEGVADLVYHAWDVDAVQAKGEAKKGSKAKKEDDLESYVYRTTEGYLAVKSDWFYAACIQAARSIRDPRSPRKNGMDLVKAAIFPLADFFPLLPKRKTWDYIDRRRAVVQHAAITRCRPAVLAGWTTTIRMQLALPDLLSKQDLHALLIEAGRTCGVAEMRPRFGRFQVTQFKELP